MFTEENFYNDGIEYNYDALNQILESLLDGSDDRELVQHYSDMINNGLVEDGDLIMYENTIVGRKI